MWFVLTYHTLPVTVDFVQVISGYQLPKPVNHKEASVLDPFVKINIYGIPDDIQKHRTKTIDDKGI